VDVKPLETLGAHVASRLESAVVANHDDDALRSRLAERAASRKPHGERSRARVFVPVFGLAAVAIAAAFHVVPRSTEPPLTFTVGTPARPGVLGESVAAPGGSGTSLRFSEGSRIALDPSARAKVASLDHPGAELVLESGRAHVDIVPRPDNAWRVHSGPFVVSVTGTRFDVDWDPGADRFALALYEGKVTVSGCSFGMGQKLVAGQRAEASCKSKTQSVALLSAPPKSESRELRVHAASEPPTANVEVGSPSPKAPSSTQTPEGKDWTSLARSGRYADAYALASTVGVAGECARRGADDVLLLGEAARLTGHADDARIAYGAVRRRFPGSPEAAQAAFNLGRLEVHAGKNAASIAWFETYLRERPSGPLAQAALGRLLEARVELGDTRAARDTARSYLERYPAGPHADAARKVLESETKR
jgi:transmembrane sensor